MEIQNSLENINNLEIENKQQEFLESSIGKAINFAVDIGIRALLPTYIEDQIIDLKNNLVNHGLEEGITKTINDVIDTGKSIVGIFKGDFSNIGEVQSVFNSGGLVEDMSGVLDGVLNLVENKGILNSNITSVIKNGKDILLDNIEKNVQNNISEQLNIEERLNKTMDLWEQGFNRKNFNIMQENYVHIKEDLQQLLPMENSINRARKIENLHNLISNNGQNFNLTQEQMDISAKI